MPNYKKMYLSLFNDVTDAIEALCQAQRKAEELYMSGGEPELTALRSGEQSEAAAE